MENFTEKIITIGINEVPRLTDSEGINWYPLRTFFKDILYRPCDVKSFRDSSFIKNMQVIEYKFPKQKGNAKMKTWFIDEDGLKKILKYVTTAKTKQGLMQLRERGLYEARLYFNVKGVIETHNQYSTMVTDFSKYSNLEMLFLEHDKDIFTGTMWKKCLSCEKFFPDNLKYFDANSKGNPKGVCKECEGLTFTTKDKDVKIISKSNKAEEIALAMRKEQYCKLMNLINEENLNFAPMCFYDKEVLIQLIEYIKNVKSSSKKNFTLKYMQKFIHISLPEMKDILGKSIKIGYIAPLSVKKKKKKKKKRKKKKPICLSERQIKAMARERFGDILLPKVLGLPELDPVFGVINKKGLFIVCKNPMPIKNAKVYKYYNKPKEVNRIFERIEEGAEDGDNKCG